MQVSVDSENLPNLTYPFWLYNFPLEIIRFWVLWFRRELTFCKRFSEVYLFINDAVIKQIWWYNMIKFKPILKYHMLYITTSQIMSNVVLWDIAMKKYA